MTTIVITTPRRVTGVWGDAFISKGGAAPRPLEPGEIVEPGDELSTGPAGVIQLSTQVLRSEQAVSLSELDAIESPVLAAPGIVAAVDRGDADAAPGTGLQAGPGGALGAGLRVDRISEATAAADVFRVEGIANAAAPEADRRLPEQVEGRGGLSADSGEISADEEGTSVGLDLSPPTGNVTSIVVDEVPAIGSIVTADGTPVVVGTVLTADELTGLIYVPPADYDGVTPPGDFSYTVSGQDGSATGTVAIELSAVNDAPVAGGDSATVAEDSSVTGNLLTNDSDVDGDSLTVESFVVGGVSHPGGSTVLIGGVGTITITTDGSYTFTPAADFNGAVPPVTVTVTDGTATSTATLTLAVTPLNDRPSTAPVTLAAIAEDSGARIITQAELLANASDVDSTSLSATNLAITSGNGTLVDNGNGSWTYTPAANDDTAVAFSYTVSDGSASIPGSATLDITPLNEPPTTAPVTLAAIAEDSGARIITQAELLANASDVDSTSLSATNLAITSGNGTLVDNGNGSWTYTPAANDDTAVAFSYTVSDGSASTPGSATLDITPVSDGAVIAGTGSGSVTEDVGVVAGNLVTGGTLTITDTDTGQAAFRPQTTTGSYGTFTLAGDGTWTYTAANANPAIQALGAGDTLSEPPFRVTAVDGTTSTVTVTINGSNDGAVIAGSVSGSATEDVDVVAGNLVISGTLTITDTDTGQAAFRPQTSTGNYGTFTLAADGTQTYTAANANPVIQALGVGDSLTETFTVAAQDGTTLDVTLTINGTNDAAVIAGSGGSVTEDVGVVAGNLVTGGTLTITDTDTGQAAFRPQTTTGLYGSFTLAGDGSWSYTAANANPVIQALGLGEQLAETFIATAIDGTTSSVTVTINGTNDGAVIAGAGSGSVTEDVGVVAGNLVTGGTLTITDTDTGQAAFRPQTTTGLYGSFTLAGDGSWTYTAANANPAIQALGLGDTLAEPAFIVTALDGTTSSVTVTINGTNDGAVIAGAGSGSVTEDVGVVAGNLVTGGTLTITDTDTGQAAFRPQTTTGLYGSFTLAGDGSWSYTAANANPVIQALGLGEQLAETFIATAIDGTTSSVTVTINGTNDGAVIAGAGSGSVTEDVGVVAGNLVTGGTLTITDTDTGQAAFRPQTTTGLYGSFTLAADGSWSYTAANANPVIQALGLGEQLAETFIATAIDGTTSTVTVTINGTNDGAVIAGAGSGSVTEDVGVVAGNLVTGGTLTITDTDTGQAAFRPQTTTGLFGSFTLAGDGSWSYTAANANPVIQALGLGEQLAETFTVTALDGTTSTVTVTINGSNDAPTAQVTPASGDEDAAAIAVVLSGTDIDGTVASFTIGTLPANGTLLFGGIAVTAGQTIAALAGTASLTFVPARDWNGSTSFSFTATDNDGTSSPAVVVPISVAAVNDVPLALASQVTAAEDSFYTFSIANFAATDVDGTIASVTIRSLPAAGDLLLDGVAVTATGLTLTAADLAAGRLQFRADADESGSDAYASPGVGNLRNDYAQFSFSVTDDGGLPSSNATMTVDVAPVVDPTSITAGATPLPAATGLTVTRHDDLATLDSLGARTLNNIEPAVEADTIAATSVIAGITGNTAAGGSVGALGTDDAYRASGFVYLQAGNTYTFGGNFADTLSLEIGGKRVVGIASDGRNDDTETFGGANYTPAVSGFYSVELITYNGGGAAGFANVNVSVNGGAALAFDSTSFNLYADAATLAAATSSVGAFVPLTDRNTGPVPALSQAGYFQHRGGPVVRGEEALLPRLAAGFADGADNSERHQVRLDLAGAPVGTRVFVDANADGVPDDGRVFTVTAASNSVVVFDEDDPAQTAGGLNWDLNNVAVDPPAGFVGTFTVNAVARAQEIANGAVVGTSESTQALPVTFVAAINLAPAVENTAANVSEEGLARGLADSVGNPDMTNSATVSGSITISDDIDLVADTITSVTLLPPTLALTSGGVPITWTGSGTGTLVGSAGGATVATLTIDNLGAYTFTLSRPIDHPTAGEEDSLDIDFGIAASDGVNTGTGTLTINVEDDSLSVLEPPITAELAMTDTNLMIVLDVSGSMNDPSAIPGLTRLQAAVQSISTLIDRYDEPGAVAVRLVTFSSSAAASGARWLSVAEAKAALGLLTAGGGTNYDAALAAAQTAFNTPTNKLGNAQNVSYFFSDGVPTAGTGIGAADEANWTTFLNANQLRSFAIGMGAGAAQAPMDPIAYNGQNNEAANAVIVTNLSQLDNVLAGTIQVPAAGPLVAGGSLNNGAAIGADGGYVRSITIDGTTYTYDPSGAGSISVVGGPNRGVFDTVTNTLAVTTTAGGNFSVDLDGGLYRYSGPNSIAASTTETMAYTVTDLDGDTQSSSVSVVVDPPNVVVGSSGAESITGTTRADFIMAREGNDTVIGGGGRDNLQGGAGNDQLSGQAGNDQIAASVGNDTLDGGDGADRLIGGAGNDLLLGGAGADVFAWQLVDRGTGGAGRAVDSITGFSAAGPAAGGDVLDLRDLLQNETSATLQNYLDFDTTSTAGTTSIRVSSTGGFAGGTYSAAREDQRITLTGVDLRTDLGLGAAATDNQIIAELLRRSSLVTDGA